jgi:hypothetical protein
MQQVVTMSNIEVRLKGQVVRDSLPLSVQGKAVKILTLQARSLCRLMCVFVFLYAQAKFIN